MKLAYCPSSFWGELWLPLIQPRIKSLHRAIAWWPIMSNYKWTDHNLEAGHNQQSAYAIIQSLLSIIIMCAWKAKVLPCMSGFYSNADAFASSWQDLKIGGPECLILGRWYQRHRYQVPSLRVTHWSDSGLLHLMVYLSILTVKMTLNHQLE